MFGSYFRTLAVILVSDFCDKCCEKRSVLSSKRLFCLFFFFFFFATETADPLFLLCFVFR